MDRIGMLQSLVKMTLNCISDYNSPTGKASSQMIILTAM